MEQPAWKILIIDDDEEDFILARQMLAGAKGRRAAAAWAGSFEAGRQALREGGYDAVLVDYDLGAHTGLELIVEAVAEGCPAPLILLTGHGSYEIDMEAMAAGATLYLAKSEVNSLLLERAIRYAIERKRTEEMLQQQARDLEQAYIQIENEKRRLEAMMQALPVAVAITDAQGGQVEGNAAYDQLWGEPRPRPETVDDYAAYRAWWVDSGLPVQPEEWASAQAVQRGEPVVGQVLEIQRFDGSRAFVINSAAPVRDAAGNIVGSAVAVQDVTPLWRAEQALDESEQRYATTLASIGDAVITTNVFGHVTFLNPVAERLTGWTQARALGAPIQEVFHIISEHTRQRVVDLFARVVELPPAPDEAGQARPAGSDRPAGQTLLVRLDGTEIPIDESGALIVDRDGQVNGLVLTFRDISGRRQAEAALKEYAHQLEQSNRELETFAFMASHDLQEPLRKIESFSRLLAQDGGQSLGEAEQDYLQRMQRAAVRMRTMIDDLLTLSRLSTAQQPFTQVDLNEIALAVLEDLEIRLHQTGGRVELDKLPVIDADPLQMQLLLQNLFSNALKFHRPDLPPLVGVEVRRLPDQQVQISVRDNGIGFDMQYAHKLFQPFQRLNERFKYEGTGIGLTICQRIIERHHGSITARAEPNQGATFVVTLPVKQDR